MAIISGATGNDTLNGTAVANVLAGKNGDDVINGLGGDDTLTGLGGDDTLMGGNGADQLDGGSGNDILMGGVGQDVLTGGTGNDIFKFTSLADFQENSTPGEYVVDFAIGDKLDLSGIDANTILGGDQAFTLAGHFSGSAGELVYGSYSGYGLLRGDIDGDGNSDFSIGLMAYPNLTAASFIRHYRKPI